MPQQPNPPLPLPKQPSASAKKSAPTANDSKDAALNLIRSKIASTYSNEPPVDVEEKEIMTDGSQSSHQDFIQSLMNSGFDLATIQTKWHAYYQSLPDTQKKQVWDEFYAHYGHVPQNRQPTTTTVPAKRRLPTITSPILGHGYKTPPQHSYTHKAPVETKAQLVNKVAVRAKLTPKHHLQSLLFGLSMGAIVLAVVMFGFFNERFIAPFITPSRTASASPIIMNPNEQVGPESTIMIPKINVDVPVVYNVASNDEKDIQDALESGVVHYPGTPVPGQNGNVVIVGHSSNNLLNKGKYKFAFVLLNRLQVGDTITMQYGGKRYVYKVYQSMIVKPTDVGVLGPTEKPASLTLITCDPPGTSVNRLVIHAEQISPAPSGNVAAAPVDVTQQTANIVPGNAPSLFDRIFGWL